MNDREWAVFLIVLADTLEHGPRSRPGTGVALATIDVTQEIMSVVGKMSKSKTTMGPFGEYDDPDCRNGGEPPKR